MVCLGHLLHEGFLERVVHLGPSLDHLLVTVLVCDKTHLIVHGNLVNSIMTILNNLLLLGRNDDIVKHEGQTALICLAVTEVLDTIEELTSTCHTYTLDNTGDDFLQCLLTNDLVNEAYLLWNHLIDGDATNSGFHKMLVWITILINVTNYTLNQCVHINLTFIVGDDGFLGTIECKSFTLSPRTHL